MFSVKPYHVLYKQHPQNQKAWGYLPERGSRRFVAMATWGLILAKINPLPSLTYIPNGTIYISSAGKVR